MGYYSLLSHLVAASLPCSLARKWAQCKSSLPSTQPQKYVRVTVAREMWTSASRWCFEHNIITNVWYFKCPLKMLWNVLEGPCRLPGLLLNNGLAKLFVWQILLVIINWLLDWALLYSTGDGSVSFVSFSSTILLVCEKELIDNEHFVIYCLLFLIH